jgi:hypothetical protein
VIVCPRCNAQWTTEAAKLNKYLCFRSCDTPLLDTDTEAGEHLNYLDSVNLQEVPDLKLREALLAVKPGGHITLPPGRYGSPIIIEKDVVIIGNPGTKGEVYIQGSRTPAVLVCGGSVSFKNIIFHKMGAQNDIPLIDVKAGSLLLESCKLDCQFGSAIHIRDGALFSGDQIDIERIGNVGLICDKGSVVRARKLSLVGRASKSKDDSQMVHESERAQTGFLVEDGARISLENLHLSRFVFGINAGESVIELGELSVESCETGIRGVKSDIEINGGRIVAQYCGISLEQGTLSLAGVSSSSVQGAVLVGVKCQKLKLIECEITGGDVAVSLNECDAHMSHCKIEGEKQLVDLRAANLQGSHNTFQTRGCSIRTSGESSIGLSTSWFNSGTNAIEIGSGGSLSLLDVEFANQSGCCIVQERETSSNLDKLKFSKCGTACYLFPEAKLDMKNSELASSNGVGIIGHSGSFLTLTKVKIIDSAADHIVLGSSTEASKIIDCELSGCGGSAIVVLDGSIVNIEECNISIAKLHGIVLGKGAQVSLRDTFVSEVTESFILLMNDSTATISGLKAKKAGKSGVISNLAAALTIEDSLIADCKESALFIIGTKELCLKSTELSSVGMQGILLVNTGSSEISGLKVDDCTGSGVDCVGITSFRLSDSNIQSSANALQLTGKISAQIVSCTFTAGHGLGMRCNSGADVELKDCELTERNSRIRIESDSRVEISNLLLKSWRRLAVRCSRGGNVKWVKIQK